MQKQRLYGKNQLGQKNILKTLEEINQNRQQQWEIYLISPLGDPIKENVLSLELMHLMIENGNGETKYKCNDQTKLDALF
ncbi:unnamed protein product [Paramecium sonneborni]|uniref:Uncharacterized protein n=1 Tax=Paramecium sonneborni TaxID=65129 RepID=A0A8S1RL12_9CILI|nr:unnamed protein product [Paramecium sonneborni]